MPRNFATRFRRVIPDPFVGDAVPVVATGNNPVTGIGEAFLMSPVRLDEHRKPTRLFQGYYTAVGFAGTLTLQAWINSGAGDWIQFGTALAAVPALRLFEATGQTEDATMVLQVTPSVPFGAGESVTLYLEEAE